MSIRIRDPHVDKIINQLRVVSTTAGLFPHLNSVGNLSYIADVAARTDATNNRFRYLNILCRVILDANQTISNDTSTIVLFGSETGGYDTHDLHSTSSNTGRLTAPIDGKYLVWGIIKYDNGDTGVRDIRFMKNGSTFAIIRQNNLGASQPAILSGLAVAQLSATDYMTMNAYHTQGTNLAITGDSTDNSTQFGMLYLGE